jgi:hypothetical protein
MALTVTLRLGMYFYAETIKISRDAAVKSAYEQFIGNGEKKEKRWLWSGPPTNRRTSGLGGLAKRLQ